MTLKELMEKNARIRKQREMARAVAEAMNENKKEEAVPQNIPEETPHVLDMGDQAVEGEQKEKKENAPARRKGGKKSGKKPAERVYMVVEDVEEMGK